MPLINLDSEINVECVRPDTGSFYKFVATDAECQLLAARFHFIEVGSLSAELRVRKSARGCWDVAGQLKGEIVQACGATGVPVSETIDFLLEERYVRTAGNPDEVEVHLITVEDEFKGPQQIEFFIKIQENCAIAGVQFTWEFDETQTLHARHIVTDHGWKVLLDRGIDIFQHYEMNDSFSLSNRLQQYRSCKAFEITYLRTDKNE